MATEAERRLDEILAKHQAIFVVDASTRTTLLAAMRTRLDDDGLRTTLLYSNAPKIVIEECWTAKCALWEVDVTSDAGRILNEIIALHPILDSGTGRSYLLLVLQQPRIEVIQQVLRGYVPDAIYDDFIEGWAALRAIVREKEAMLEASYALESLTIEPAVDEAVLDASFTLESLKI